MPARLHQRATLANCCDTSFHKGFVAAVIGGQTNEALAMGAGGADVPVAQGFTLAAVQPAAYFVNVKRMPVESNVSFFLMPARGGSPR